MKIKFESNDDLPLDEILNIPVCVLNISGGVFKEDGKYYSQILLHECYERKYKYLIYL